MRDRYISLDRLVRHTREAFERIDEKLAYHREHKHNPQILKLKGRAAKLQTTYAYELARIQWHIRNIEQPPAARMGKRKDRRR